MQGGRKIWEKSQRYMPLMKMGGVGEFIGYFDFYDTGAGIDTDGDGKGDSIKKGKSVDVFRNSLDDCNKFIKTYGDYVFIKIIEAEG